MKDIHDKVEIWGKAAGAVIIPVAVAATAYFWNINASERQTAAQMSELAIDILREPTEDRDTDDALRSWAVSVLGQPSNPPRLSEAAARHLQVAGLPDFPFVPSSLEIPADLLSPCENIEMLPEAPPDVYEATSLLLEARMKYRGCAAKNRILAEIIESLGVRPK